MAVNGVARTGGRGAGSHGLPPGSPSWIVALQRGMQGSVSVPGMANYESARADASPRYSHRPAAIAFCATEQDVRTSLLTAQASDIAIRLRSGRHHLAGYSNVDDGLVIDVSQLRHVTVDRGARAATVGAGANLRELNAALDVHMLHVPTGAWPTIGIAGYMQGGGYGWTSRQYGMNCDCVAAVRVMLADGRVIRATRDLNPSLLWAVCGGTGGNFGVLLDVTYDLGELCAVWGFELRWPIHDAAQVLATIQASFTRFGDAPDELGFKLLVATFDDEQVLIMQGMLNGDRERGTEAIAPLTAIGACRTRMEMIDTYTVVNDWLLSLFDDHALTQSIQVYRSGHVVRPLGIDGWDAFIERFKTSSSALDVVVIAPYGGRLARIAADDCAFVHRAVDLHLSIYAGLDAGRPKDAEEQAWGWLNDTLDFLEPFTDGSVYQNLPERGLADYRTAYWGSNFGRLLAVKRIADPDDVFAYPQSVSPDPALTTTVERLPELEPEPDTANGERLGGMAGARYTPDALPSTGHRDAVVQRTPAHARLFDRMITLQAEAQWGTDLGVLVRSPEWLTATTVLDLGAGSGAFGRRLAARFPMKSIVALEPDEELYAIGARTAGPPNYVYLNTGFEPGLEGFFDVMIARRVLMYMPERRSLARWAAGHCAAVLIMNNSSEASRATPDAPLHTAFTERLDWSHPADFAAEAREAELSDTPQVFAAAGFTLTGSTTTVTKMTGGRGRILAHHLLRSFVEIIDAAAITTDLLDELFEWSLCDDACLRLGATWYRFCNKRGSWPSLAAA